MDVVQIKIKCGHTYRIFGGGGFGAAADAVINETGNVIGVNMTNFGLDIQINHMTV